MNKRTVLYAQELQKNFRSRTFTVMLIVGIVFLVLLIALSELIGGFTIEIGNAVGGGNSSDTEIATPAQGIAIYENMLEAYQKGVESGAIKKKFYDTTEYKLKAQLTYYRYLSEHNLGVNQATPYGATLGFGGFAFLSMAMGVALELAVIMAILFGSKSMAGELSDGQMKMLLLRPVKRKTVYTAKWTATFTVCAVYFFGLLLLAMIYGAARFGINGKDVVMIVAGTSAFQTGAFGAFTMEAVAGLIVVFAYIQLTYCVGAWSKSKVAALVVPLVLYLAGSLLSTILGFIYVGYVDFNANLSLMSAFSANGPMFNGMSIYTMLPIVGAYVAAFLYMGYYRFTKQDIH